MKRFGAKSPKCSTTRRILTSYGRKSRLYKQHYKYCKIFAIVWPMRPQHKGDAYCFVHVSLEGLVFAQDRASWPSSLVTPYSQANGKCNQKGNCKGDADEDAKVLARAG